MGLNPAIRIEVASMGNNRKHVLL